MDSSRHLGAPIEIANLKLEGTAKLDISGHGPAGRAVSTTGFTPTSSPTPKPTQGSGPVRCAPSSPPPPPLLAERRGGPHPNRHAAQAEVSAA